MTRFLFTLALGATMVSCSTSDPSTQPRALKVLLLYDMEGVTAATSYEYTNAYHTTEYEEGRLSLTEDVNAAIRGLVAAGATEILTVDGHGSENEAGPDILIDQLLPPARALMRDASFDQYLDAYDQSFAAIVAIGMHAAAGNRAGFLGHTYSGEDERYEVNGVPFNESMLLAALAARRRVPLMMVSGDDQLMREIRQHMPWVRYAVVKRALDHSRAESIERHEASRRIEQEARQALEGLSDARLPEWPPPYRFSLTFQDEAQAAAAEMVRGAAARDGRTVEARSDRFEEGYRTSVRMLQAAIHVGWSTALEAALTSPADGTPPRLRATRWWYERFLGRRATDRRAEPARQHWGAK